MKTASYIKEVALDHNLSKKHADACKALLYKIPRYSNIIDAEGIYINEDTIVLNSEGEEALKRLLGFKNEVM